MSLNKNTLSQAMLTAFHNMNDMASTADPITGNTYAANQIALALNTYLLQANISTPTNSDIGIYLPSYAYTGTTSGTGIAINVATLTTSLAAHFMEDNLSDDKIANYIANDINTALASAVITPTTSGTYVVPGNPPQTYSGSGTGVGIFTGVSSDISEGLKTIFADMLVKAKDPPEGYDGNKEFADKLADCIDNYMKRTGCLIVTYTTPVSAVVTATVQ